MKRCITLAALIFTSVTFSMAQTPSSPTGSSSLERIPKHDHGGTAFSVRVPDQPLVFTGQVFAPAGTGEPRAEADAALKALETTLAKAGAALAGVVRLNAYVADDTSVSAVEAAVAEQFAGAPPAFTLVRSPLTQAQARVAFDAVTITSRAPSTVEVVDASAAVLPAGGKLFISGQVVRGTDLASGAKLTMGGLFRSLEHLGLGPADVVQVKAFIKPFEDHAAASREIAASFAGARVPPIIIMEWVSDIYTEIELVASARDRAINAADGIVYTMLPWLTASPRYCHVSQVAAGTPLIFIGAIDGGDANDPRTQMKTIFERLGSILFEAGSSFRNMAKATYYLNDPIARSMLGDIRAVYYDPTRAPAASALGVNGLGRPGRAAIVDMIAVPIK